MLESGDGILISALTGSPPKLVDLGIAGHLPQPVRSALAFMHENCPIPISLKEIADAGGRSTRQLLRLFKDHLGATPARRLILCRVARAARILRG